MQYEVHCDFGKGWECVASELTITEAITQIREFLAAYPYWTFRIRSYTS